MVFQENLVTPLAEFQRHQPFLLKDLQGVCLVVSGEVAIFASEMAEEQLRGERYYLFTLHSGEILCPVPVEGRGQQAGGRRLEIDRGCQDPALFTQPLGLLAVPLEPLQLRPLPDFKAEIAQGNAPTMARLGGWLGHLGETLTEAEGRRQKAGGRRQGAEGRRQGAEGRRQGAEGRRQELGRLSTCSRVTPYSLETNQVIQPPSEQLVWVKVHRGQMSWQDFPSLCLDGESPWFPLVQGMGLTAQCPTEIEVIPEINPEIEFDLTASLGVFHGYFCSVVHRYRQQQQEEAFRRFQAREQLNQQLSASALDQLVSVLQPQPILSDRRETPLLMAAGAVGRRQKIEIKPPGTSENLNLLQNPLEAIARASQCRIRRVQLLGRWWQEDHGPILAYTQEDHSPIALLPETEKGDGYLLFDPVNNCQVRVTATLAQTIARDAYVFYRPLPLLIHTISQLFRFGIRGYEKDILFMVMLGTVASLLGMVVPQMTGLLIDQVIPDSDGLLLWQMGLGLLAAALGKSAFELSQGIITLRVENGTDVNLQLAVWDRLLKITPAFFRRYPSGDWVNRLMAIRQIRAQLSGATQRTLFSGIFSLLNLGLMFIYSVKLAWVGLGLSLLVILVTGTSGLVLVGQQRQQEQLDGDLEGLTVQLIGGVTKLRVAGAEERAFAAWAHQYSQKTKLTLSIQQINDAVSALNEALPLISSVLLFWFAMGLMEIAQINDNATGLTPGTFLAFNVAFATFIQGVTDLSNTLTDILGIVPLWERAKSIVGAPTESDPHCTDAGRLRGDLVLDRITFRYRKDGPFILDNVSLEAHTGEFIAIVGPSGSGKSTLFRLLLGFEMPQSGTVYYDGQDLGGLDVISVRRQLGVVLQNGRVQQTSIFENIACGALITFDDAWKVAEMAGLADDIRQMPMGMHTVVSEGGSNLSGGQRQRLLIARALVGQPKIILMDEATSALDNHTQGVVTQSLESLKVTRLVIAHRLSTIRRADRIYVLEAGRVVQVGSFAQLMQQDGLFSRLIARQLT